MKVIIFQNFILEVLLPECEVSHLNIYLFISLLSSNAHVQICSSAAISLQPKVHKLALSHLVTEAGKFIMKCHILFLFKTGAVMWLLLRSSWELVATGAERTLHYVFIYIESVCFVLYCFLEYRMMENVQKTVNSECHAPSLELFGIYLYGKIHRTKNTAAVS